MSQDKFSKGFDDEMDKWIDQMISTLEVIVATPVLMPLLIICMKPDSAAEENVTPKVPETVPELYDMALRKTIRQNGGAEWEVVVIPLCMMLNIPTRLSSAICVFARPDGNF